MRRSYLRHGLVVHNGAVVIDAGANIGLFSLQCLREAKRVKVSVAGQAVHLVPGMILLQHHYQQRQRPTVTTAVVG